MFLVEIAERFKLRFSSESDKEAAKTLVITGVTCLREATKSDLSVQTVADSNNEWETSAAGAMIVEDVKSNFGGIQLIHEDPRYVYAQIGHLFAPVQAHSPRIDPSAKIHPSAVIGERVTIGPYVHIGEKVVIGDDTIIEQNTFVDSNVEIGSSTRIAPNVVIWHGTHIGSRTKIGANTVIGTEGFIYRISDYSELVQQRSFGGVFIANDVSIGSLVIIDRSADRDTYTIVKGGCKIDSHVYVAHDANLGQNSTLTGMCGLAGYVTVGKWTRIYGHAGIRDGVKIGEYAIIGGHSGIAKDVESNTLVSGFPGMPMKDWMKQVVFLKNHEKTIAAIEDLLKRVQELEEKIGDASSSKIAG